MRERRLPWVVASVLLLASAGAAAWSTYLHWTPCRGALLSYSVLEGYQQGPGPGFSDECLRWMDSASLPFPSSSESWESWAHTQGSAGWAVAAMVLAGAAWLVLVLGLRWSVRTKAVAVLPGLAMLTLAAYSAGAAVTGPPASDVAAGWLGVAPYAAALVALTAIWHWQPEVQERYFGRLVVVAWGITAFGTVHAVVDYMVMTMLSAANWDTPPLTGSVTVLAVLASATLTLALALRPPRPADGGTTAVLREVPDSAV